MPREGRAQALCLVGIPRSQRGCLGGETGHFSPEVHFRNLDLKSWWLRFQPLKMQVPLACTMGVGARGVCDKQAAAVLYSMRGLGARHM